MLQSLQAGVSGLRNHQTMLDVTGNNIANVNTIGFKSSRATFADSLYDMLRVGRGPRDRFGGVNPLQVGFGVNMQTMDRDYSQGGLNETGYATDLAIQGSGFFIVRDGVNTVYTRAGNFTVDENGNLVAGNGGVVQGRMADEAGEVSTHATYEDLSIPLQMKISPRATTSVRFYCNLDSSATNSEATLNTAGTSGVLNINGTATNGVGGQHTVEITGANATNSTNIGTSATGPLTLDTLLSAAGITDVEGLEVTVDVGTDNEHTFSIVGLDITNTVGELINQLNAQVSGANFELDGGQIRMSRSFAGDGTEYNLTIGDTGTSDVVSQLFTNGGGATMAANSGTASTLVAIDTFVDNRGNSAISTLQLEADETTGLMTGINGLGDGGVTINAPDGLSAAVGADALIIDTEDTEHLTTILVYDSLGNTHSLQTTFVKTAEDNQWAWEVSMSEPAQVAGGDTGLITFNEDGSLESFVHDDSLGYFEFIPGGGAERVQIDFNPGILDTMQGVTQTSAPFLDRSSRTGWFWYGYAREYPD